MGISGLNTFFDNNPHLSKPYELHNTKVVIDGNNLANALYFDDGLDCLCGGDYNRYATLVKHYFLLYLQCGIEPIVIFDGGYDKTDSKLRTVMQRASKRLQCSVRMSKQQSSSGYVLPILALRVFKDVLQEMDIRYAQCFFEADSEITAIANHYQCPVISRDSDFYIFDVTFGFIRLDYIDVNVQKRSGHEGQVCSFLNCAIYHVDSFLSLFPGIKKCILPLFSTLVGNDFVDEFVFNDFFLSVQLPKVELENLRLNERHAQMIGLMLWLKHHDMRSATKEVLKHIKEEEQEPVKKLIEQATNAYRFEKSDLVNYFDQVSYASTTNLVPNLFTFRNNHLPRWFAKCFHEADLSPFILNVVCLRRVFLQGQVEDTTLVSAYTCSLHIRQVLYGLLLSFDDVSEHNASENCVEEYDRVEERLQKTLVKPVFWLDGLGTLPPLSEKQFDEETARLLVLHTLGERSKFLRGLPDFLQLYMLCIRYYLRNCLPKPAEDFIDALLVATIYLSVAEPLVTEEHLQSSDCVTHDCLKLSRQSFKNVSVSHVSECVSPSNASFLRSRLKPYLQKPVPSREHSLVLPIIHSYVQLQGCLNFALMLNEFVGRPFVTPRIQFTLNGSLTYNFAKKLMEQDSRDSFVHAALGRDSALDHMFRKLKKKVLKNLPRDCLKWRKKRRGSTCVGSVPKRSARTCGIRLHNQFDALRNSSRYSKSANTYTGCPINTTQTLHS